MILQLFFGQELRLFTSKRASSNEKIHYNNSQHTFQNSLLGTWKKGQSPLPCPQKKMKFNSFD
jgi:hypothetical protein